MLHSQARSIEIHNRIAAIPVNNCLAVCRTQIAAPGLQSQVRQIVCPRLEKDRIPDMAVVDRRLNLSLNLGGHYGDGGSVNALRDSEGKGEQQGKSSPGCFSNHDYLDLKVLSASRQERIQWCVTQFYLRESQGRGLRVETVRSVPEGIALADFPRQARSYKLS